mgnify:CR=1 FL=1
MDIVNPLPRWRGFNLLEMYTQWHHGDFHEDDFRWLADWGFDFVRIPMSYRLWVEGGAYKHTPHKVFLAWLADVPEILASLKIGYALWNFRGGFGVLDSGRADVDYEDWYGHKLDRRMLELLRRF